MPTLQIVSARPLSGKTTVAVSLAQGIAERGGRVRLVRAGTGNAANEDAVTFLDCMFATSLGEPVTTPAPAAAGETVILEVDAGGALDGLPAIVVVRGASTAEDVTLAKSLGERLVGTIAVAVAARSVEDVGRDLTNTGMHPLAVTTEDRTLAAPSVDEIRDALGARVLYAGENEREVVEDVLIAPIYADPAQPHFRRFASKAVLAPFNKTDLHLAAIETQAACLVITGGRDPSPYVIDRAQGEATTILLAPQRTAETVAALSEVWLTSRFRGDRKTAAAARIRDQIDFQSLTKKIEA
ncbi:MAG TPA: DRTGG domain-containing protein [Dehalococcoidia bacterium]|nr:DRTGG domain-containing protein [Dehalococcoidia bacterium]